MLHTVDWKVFVDGRDMTTTMKPFILSITVEDKDGSASDTCKLDFDDASGQLEIPGDSAQVKVYLQGVLVFEGSVDDITSKGSKPRGMTLCVSAKGFDAKGEVKGGQYWHLDNATLKQALEKAANKAKLAGIRVDGDLASIRRDYWSPDGTSFLAWGQKLAREHNATFKIRGDRAVFAKRGKDQLPRVQGVVGQNVISWNIKPLAGRRKFKKATAQWFDRNKAQYLIEEINIDSQNATATNKLRTTLTDRDQAIENLKARKSEAEREGGSGSVELDLTINAQAEAPFILDGARPGVDGKYRIVSVTHKVTRASGSTTSLQLKQPERNGEADRLQDQSAEAQAINQSARQYDIDNRL